MSARSGVEEKIDALVEKGWPIAFDGCHKIYFLQDAEREAQAEEFGYEIYSAADLPDLYERSCGLRFVSRWGYDNDDFAHELNIAQFEGDDEGEEE
jgi:hypothetical protein